MFSKNYGGGKWVISKILLMTSPAQLALIDISENMLDLARTRFEHNTGVRYIVDDYSKHVFEEDYDAIISALSIHHLADNEKQLLYEKYFSILKPGGVFVNAEQVLGETPYLDKFYKSQWKKSIEQSGLPIEEVSGSFERIKLDKETALQTQLEWLRSAGFSDVACIYKYYNFAVLFGRKDIS